MFQYCVEIIKYTYKYAGNGDGKQSIKKWTS